MACGGVQRRHAEGVWRFAEAACGSLQMWLVEVACGSMQRQHAAVCGGGMERRCAAASRGGVRRLAEVVCGS